MILLYAGNRGDVSAYWVVVAGCVIFEKALAMFDCYCSSSCWVLLQPVYYLYNVIKGVCMIIL